MKANPLTILRTALLVTFCRPIIVFDLYRRSGVARGIAIGITRDEVVRTLIENPKWLVVDLVRDDLVPVRQLYTEDGQAYLRPKRGAEGLQLRTGNEPEIQELLKDVGRIRVCYYSSAARIVIEFVLDAEGRVSAISPFDIIWNEAEE